LLAFCQDGDKLAHEWSSGDLTRYTYAETQAQLHRAREKLSGPTTCAKFHSVNAAVCEKCPFWGTNLSSPIVLGRADMAMPTSVPMSNSPATPPSSDQTTIASPTNWERTQKGARKSNSYVNARIAIKKLELVAMFDVFHNKKWVRGGGEILERTGPELSDTMCRVVRDLIIVRFNFDPSRDHVKEALERACEETRFDPIQDYLDGLRWDGQPRVDRWLTTYLGVDDTPFVRAAGGLTLIAAVRRARKPGVKFDYMLILEGPQRAGKSSSLRILAGGPENFSDQGIMHLKDEKAQQEQIEGIWIYEIAELVGLRRAEVERVKTFLSRTHDKARPAYGRYRIDQPRRCIFLEQRTTPNISATPAATVGSGRFELEP
jgi:predicted P-loop ATPase